MSVAVASRYHAPTTNSSMSAQLSEEEFEKLQEIHELISLMLRELPLRAPSAAQLYFTAALPMSPYTHAYRPWERSPYLTPTGF